MENRLTIEKKKLDIYYIETNQIIKRRYAIATNHLDEAQRILVFGKFPKNNSSDNPVLLIGEELLEEKIDQAFYDLELKARHSIKEAK